MHALGIYTILISTQQFFVKDRDNGFFPEGAQQSWWEDHAKSWTHVIKKSGKVQLQVMHSNAQCSQGKSNLR